MGGGDGGGILAVPAAEEKGGQGQALSHGGAGPVQAKVGDGGRPGGKGGADALVQQVAGQQNVQVGGVEPRPFEGGVQRQLLHLRLRLFPALFSEGVVLACVVKMAAQGSSTLFVAGGGAVADDDGRTARPEGLAAQFGVFHGKTPLHDGLD